MTKNMVQWSNQMDPTKWDVNEIQIAQSSNCNYPYMAMKKHEGTLRVSWTINACLNRFEINARWGMPLDSIDRASLHATLDEWLDSREEIMTK